MLILNYCLSFGQYKSEMKFQLGLSYSLTSDDNSFFSNPISFYGNYQLRKWDKLDLNVGMKSFYFSSEESNYTSSKWGFNPNLSASYYFSKDKFNTYFGVGYYFDSFETTPTIIGLNVNPKRDIKTNGIIIVPGLKYFIHQNIFFDLNCSFLFARTSDDYYKTAMGNNTFLNLGVGTRF